MNKILLKKIPIVFLLISIMTFVYADKKAVASDPITISCIQKYSNVSKQIAKDWLLFAINKRGDYGSSTGNCMVATSYLDSWAKNGIVHVSEAKEWLRYGFSPTSGFIGVIRANGYTPRTAKYYLDKGFSKYDLGTKYSYAYMQRSNSHIKATNQCKSIYKVEAIRLNIRDRASSNSNIVGVLNNGDTICAHAKSGNWVQINRGWVSIKYLKEIHQGSPYYSTSLGETVSYQQVVSADNNTSEPAKSNMTGEVITSLFVLMMAIYVVMLLVGMAGKVVVYYDEADLLISLMPWLILFVTVIIVGIYQPTEQDMDPEKMLQIQKIVWYVGGVLSTGFAVWAMQLSIKYNKSILIGLIFGIFKLLSGLIGVLVLISQIFTMKDEKTKRKDFWFAILVFGSFWWLGKKLINGKKVYREKGWVLPK